MNRKLQGMVEIGLERLVLQKNTENTLAYLHVLKLQIEKNGTPTLRFDRALQKDYVEIMKEINRITIDQIALAVVTKQTLNES